MFAIHTTQTGLSVAWIYDFFKFLLIIHIIIMANLSWHYAREHLSIFQLNFSLIPVEWYGKYLPYMGAQQKLQMKKGKWKRETVIVYGKCQFRAS